MKDFTALDTDPFTEGDRLPEPLPEHPWGVFRQWWDLAHGQGQDGSGKPVQPNPNAMSLATIGEGGAPACRIVLCKKFDLDAGWICFFTNYDGRKGRHLSAHPQAAACFHWDTLDRQVRIEGDVVRSPDEESDAYFASRALVSRLGAWASDQSEPIASRKALLEKYSEVMERFRVPVEALDDREMGQSIEIPRPAHWGGFRIWARRVELWIGGRGRFHDRAIWTRDLGASETGTSPGPWKATRLQP